MKKFLMLVVLVLSINISNAQNVVRDGNVFSFSTGELKSSKSNVRKTDFVWKDSKNNQYPIYVTESTGSCFIIRTSKNGKEYRKYLGEELSKEVCKALNISYKSKKK